MVLTLNMEIKSERSSISLELHPNLQAKRDGNGVTRVGMVSRRKRHNRTHEILMPSEQFLSDGIVFTNLYVSRTTSAQLRHTA